MKVNIARRISAYIIDIVFIGIIITLIGYNFINDHNLKVINREMSVLNEKYVQKKIKTSEYIKEYSVITKKIDSEQVIVSIISISMVMIYFVIVPYFIQGKTLGLYIFKLKIVRYDDQLLSLNNLLIRSLIINGLAFFSLSLVFIYIFSGLLYFIMVSILGIIQFALVIKSATMVIYNKNGLGIQDVLSKTKLIYN